MQKITLVFRDQMAREENITLREGGSFDKFAKEYELYKGSDYRYSLGDGVILCQEDVKSALVWVSEVEYQAPGMTLLTLWKKAWPQRRRRC